MRASEFVFDYVQSLYYKCHKINVNCGGSYIDSVDLLIYSIDSISFNDIKRSNGEKHKRSETLAMQTKSEGCEANSEGRPQWHYLAVKKLSAL